jgi:predicted XRE-type DNA-binding protein
MEQKKEDAKQGKGEFSDDTEEDEITEIPKDLRDAKIRDLATAGIEQKKIAEAFDLSQSTVSRIANNQ